MNPASTIEFRENRRKFTLADLQPYDGQWVAFSADGRRIVDSAENLGDLFGKLRDASQDMNEVGFEQIQISDDIYIGGAEFL